MVSNFSRHVGTAVHKGNPGSIEDNAHNSAKVGIDGAKKQKGTKFAPLEDGVDAVDDAPGDRHCICDENVQCTNCSDDGQCSEHDGLYCSSCDCWYHAKCIGGIISEVDGVKTMIVRLSEGKSIRFMLHGPSQDSDPWFCIRCWENEKLRKRNGADPVLFNDASVAEQALRLGVDPTLRKNVKEKTLRARHLAYATKLPAAIGDDQLAQSILGSTPRAYPTPKPMNNDARLNLKCAGRRFEIAQLCLKIDTCDCCGLTRPCDADPWRGNNATTGQTVSGSHLRRTLYQAHKCVM
jgi:hypothetical protein